MVASPPNPVVVIPGVTASSLRDEYEVDPESVWGLLRKSYDRVALHPDDVRYEEREPSRVVADRVFGVPYEELVAELRHDLSPRADRPTPVYPFAYDWRQPLEHTVLRLGAFVDEVIARTRLMRHYHGTAWTKDPQVNLVGHSMGGLVIAGYLREYGPVACVGRVATLATPFRGSLEAVVKIATGLAVLGESRPSSREREVARITPALYYLAPGWKGAAVAEDDPSDAFGRGFFFDVESWQPSVLQTLAEYVRLHGLPGKGSRTERARALFESMLDSARRYRAGVEKLDLAESGLTPDDWLCIVGVGEDTRTRMAVAGVPGRRRFVITSRDRRDRYFEYESPDERVRTGDGTVPYHGARAPFVPVEKVVCVSPREFGFWEWGDRVLEGFAGFHGILPKMNLVHRLVASHFGVRRGERATAGKGTLGRAAPDLPDDVPWDPPLRTLRKRG